MSSFDAGRFLPPAEYTAKLSHAEGPLLSAHPYSRPRIT